VVRPSTREVEKDTEGLKRGKGCRILPDRRLRLPPEKPDPQERKTAVVENAGRPSKTTPETREGASRKKKPSVKEK